MTFPLFFHRRAYLYLLLLACGCSRHDDNAAMRIWIDKIKQTRVPPALPPSAKDQPQQHDLPDTQALADPFSPANETAHELASVSNVSNDDSAPMTQAAAPVASLPPVRLLGTLARAGEAYAILVVGDSTLSLKAGDALPDRTGKLLRIDAAGAEIQTPAGIQRLAFADSDAVSNPAAPYSTPHAPTPTRRQRHRLTGAAS